MISYVSAYDCPQKIGTHLPIVTKRQNDFENKSQYNTVFIYSVGKSTNCPLIIILKNRFKVPTWNLITS